MCVYTSVVYVCIKECMVNVCAFTRVCVHECVGVCARVLPAQHQRMIQDVLFYHSPSYYFETLSLKFTVLDRLAGQRGICLSLVPSTGVHRQCFDMSIEDLDSVLHACPLSHFLSHTFL